MLPHLAVKEAKGSLAFRVPSHEVTDCGYHDVTGAFVVVGLWPHDVCVCVSPLHLSPSGAHESCYWGSRP